MPVQGIKNRVFGSDIPNEVKKKLESRQLLARKDREPNEQIKPSNYPDSRPSYYTYEELNEMNFDGVADLSSRTPFARMWTAVNVSTDVLHKEMSKEDAIDWENKKETAKPDDPLYKNRYLKEVGESNADKKYEIHEWVEVDDSERIYVLGNHVLGTEQVGPNSPITTAAGNVSANIMKELLPHEQETDQNAFLKPPAGITSISSNTEGAMGTIKKTRVSFIVHNFEDFDKIYLRYFMKPGAQVFIDFGWDTGYLYDPIELLKTPDEIEDKLYGDTGYVTLSKGDMESLYGHVVNYDAKVREDGGFDCEVEILSKNAALLSNSFDRRLKERVKYGLDIEIMGYAVSGVMKDPNLYKKASQWGQADTTEEELREAFTTATIKLLGGTTAPLPGMIDTETSMAALEQGVFYSGTMEENMKLFVNYGWFEDKFLNKELGFGDDKGELMNENTDGTYKSEGKLHSKFNSRNSYVTYSKRLRRAMFTRGFAEGAMILYPESWGKDGHTYNTKKGMIPDRYDKDGNIIKADDGGGLSGADFALKLAKDHEDIDRKEGKLPLREIFISVDSIKSSFDTSNTTSEFLKSLINKIKDSTGGIMELAIQSNSYGQHTIAFVDKNILGTGAETPPTEPGKLSEYLKSLLVFNPYSPDTIVKEYDLQFSMPQNGLGNMLAMQSADSIGNDQSINSVIDGLMKLESMNRKGEFKDKFVRYHPSIGREAGRRLIETTTRESAGTFNFSDKDIAHGNNLNKPNDANIKTQVKVGAPYSAHQDQLYTQITRALDPNQNLSGEDTTPEPEVEKSPEDSKKSEEDIAKNRSQTLVKTPYDYWIKDAVKAHSSKVIPLLPIEISLKIYGISGLVPGDLIRVNYLPKQYYLYAYFQITQITQTIGETWDTEIQTQMRIAPFHTETPKREVRVGKSYLRNVLKLEDMDSYIHAFGNLKPLATPQTSTGDRLVYIDNIFECEAVGSIDGRFSPPVLWSPGTPEQLKKAVSGNFKWGTWVKGGDKAPNVKMNTNKEWSAGLQDIFLDDVDYSGFENRVENLKKGYKFYIITSGDKWLIWNSLDINQLSDINKLLGLGRGKEIKQEYKDISWKATGQQLLKKGGEIIAPVGDFIESAGDAIEDAWDDPVGTLKDVGKGIKDFFGGWW